MKTILKTKMGKQINLFLRQSDLKKIQKYLLDRQFMFFADQITPNPHLFSVTELITSDSEWARFLAFENTFFNYLSLEKEGITQFRPTDHKTETITFSYYDRKDDLFRVRFYYCPYYFENQEKKFKNPDFSLQVDRFFRWLRAQFKPVPDMPTFYYNPDFAPKEWF
ncbi:MAG: hypothetical protein EAZ97_11175 [Bacteroidetes bacterium]|nr:MAG: hypothetical protein EAZ97_11175 [Bacteroidota bacterium]